MEKENWIKIAIGLGAFVCLILGYSYGASREDSLGRLVHTFQESFVAGIKAGSSNNEVINSSGQWVGAVNGTTGTFSGAVSGTTGTFTGASTFATTTVDRSFDGFMAGGSFSVTATNTPITLYTHTGSPVVCDSSASAAVWDSTAFSPSLQFSIGTSTATTPTANLIATSTVATTTDTFIPSDAAVLFRLNAGDAIIGLTADITNANASSTNYGNWDVEYQTQCWLIGG